MYDSHVFWETAPTDAWYHDLNNGSGTAEVRLLGPLPLSALETKVVSGSYVSRQTLRQGGGQWEQYGIDVCSSQNIQ